MVNSLIFESLASKILFDSFSKYTVINYSLQIKIILEVLLQALCKDLCLL